MLWVSTDVTTVLKFRDFFRSQNSDRVWIDLSAIPSTDLGTECKSIAEHHSNCAVFLGYLEPGWMVSMQHQTLMRRLIRKFPVAMCCFYTESLPFSWKNEIEFLFSEPGNSNHGSPNSINDGGSVHHESEVRHGQAVD